MNFNKQRGNGEIAFYGFCFFVLLFIIVGLMWGIPQYRVYSQRQAGMALLAHAQSSKEVAVAEAKAKLESASLLSEAEVIRAQGVAKANQIIGDSLKGNEAYLRYLWINNLEKAEVAGGQIIYVPTEAGLPILEAQRLAKDKAKPAASE